MTDISKCNGEQCPIREECWRYISQANSLWQSYIEPPVEKPINKDNCVMYWPLNKQKEKS